VSKKHPIKQKNPFKIKERGGFELANSTNIGDSDSTTSLSHFAPLRSTIEIFLEISFF
jgi:hypothetical protein